MADPHLDTLLEFLRFKSISTDPAFARDVADCARWLCERLQRAGLNAAVHPTAKHPVVVARNEHRAGRPTVLIYGHYDVQPVDPLELWTHPPFDPQVIDGRIFARGSADNKGQIMAHILGVESTLRRGSDLPVNIIFLIEGEEEIGSPNISTYLREHRDELRCDSIVVSDSGMIGPGVPTFSYGLRGIAAIEVKVTGPTMDLHSGSFGGAVANPITALARMLATLHDAHGRVAVAGYYDGVEPLQPWEHEAWAKLPGDEELRAMTGVPELFGESGFSATERLWVRPTVEVNGIGGGYQGAGGKTVIPSEAFAKITLRLVPNQVPATALKLVVEHLQKACPPGVRATVTGELGGDPYVMDPHSAQGLAAQRALRETFGGAEPALIRQGGSIPIVQAFKDILGVETLLLGLALPDCRAHSPNENFPIENFEAGMRLNQALLKELAAV